MDYFEQIEAYLNNTLSESERLAFEKAMESDSKLKQAVDDHSIAMDVVGSILEDEVRKVIDNEELIIENVGEETDSSKLKVENDGDREDSAAIKRINWMRWVAAAIVVFVVGWWGMGELSGIDDSKLYSETYSDASWPIEKGGDADNISKSISRYFSGAKEDAKSELRSYSTTEANYWLAELYYKEMEFDSTLLILHEQNNIDNKNRRDRINYLRILSLYFGGDKSKAKEAVDLLPQDTDIFYKKIYSRLSF